ncbi:MAG TPA: cytochrome c oxidase assembly protein [Gammaproteobacteria bacterium]
MKRVCALLLPGAVAALSWRSACAHGGVAGHAAGPAWWAVDPWSLLLLAAAAWCYARGRHCIAQRGGRSGSGSGPGARLFWSGWGALALALGPPLDPLGGWLFSAHMLQHEILMLLSAPLLVLSRPFGYLLWGLPRAARHAFARLNRVPWLRAGGAWLVSPHGAWIVHAVMLWGWHLPFLFAASLTNDAVHAAQHTGFFVSALLFWWALLMNRGRSAGAVIYLFTTALHSGALGAMLTFAPTVWYAPYQTTTLRFGLSALEDQQLGGLIMWVPSGLVFLAAGLAMVARALREAGMQTRRLEYGSDPEKADG